MSFNPFRIPARWLRRRPRANQQITIPSLHLGSDYGGYAVASDLVTRDSVVYSFGIGEDLSFDLALIERFGCAVHAFDPTPRSLAWAKTQALPENLHIHGVGLADHDGIASFSPPANPKHVSHSLTARNGAERIEFEVKSLDTLMRELCHDRIDILKMDIEGAEYPVIDQLAHGATRPAQILLEFHHQLPGVTVARTDRALRTLGQLGYKIFHCQPSGHEFSLVHQAWMTTLA